MRNAAARSNLLVPEIREVMDIRQASDYLGISPDTLYKYRLRRLRARIQAGNRCASSARGSMSGWTAQSDIHAADAELDPHQKKPVRPRCKFVLGQIGLLVHGRFV